jgi:hypothetical protein
VSVQHRGQNIAGSPFSAEVLHTAIDADSSYVVQEGIERGVSGVPVCIRLFVEWCHLQRLPALHCH